MKAILAIAATFALAADSYTPVWEEYDKLVCKGGEMLSCSGTADSCEERESKVDWLIDFKRKSISYAGSDIKIDLIGFSAGTAEFPHDKFMSESGHSIVIDRNQDGGFGTFKGWTTSGWGTFKLMQHELHCTGR